MKLLVLPIEHRPGMSRRNAECLARDRALTLLGIDPRRLRHTPHGAPYIEGNEDMCVSVSHSRHRVAVLLSTHAAAVDIEQDRPQLQRVAHKFVAPHEHGTMSLVRIWTAKEAIFKAARRRGVDFAGHISIAGYHGYLIQPGQPALRFSLLWRDTPYDTMCVAILKI